ncbi:UDP:flavonoid glycosyltransferase YjiC (YdhE family) [Sphingomonas insulae]|uniref:Glycosyltransferase n=2 Tax=Sphingomonas insulae TaxID=424800 RepID=A0ABN1I0E2_9SPHN|nr:glycosyltransferase [Sphingomonas insulae]NIJ31265.1 UDP:flavonoid glycosyltransferase YjiC (YdhE family) [Sphingomonas insulae]
MKALLVTIGSLGDLHPFIAIGLALHTQGHDVLLAVPADHADKVHGTGLAAAVILPSFASICSRLEIDAAEAARRVLTQRSFVMESVILPSLANSVAALDALAGDVDVIVGSTFALAAGIVAEKRGLPLVSLNLQPMALLSACDPPVTPELPIMVHAPTGPIGRRWNAGVLTMLRLAIRARYGGAVTRVRAAHGLPPNRTTPLFDPVAAQVATLCCYSPVLAPIQPDAPPGTEAIGFPLFDREHGALAPLDPRLTAFLDRGPAPIVFTLGSFIVHAPGAFYSDAVAAARTLGRRAVLLTGAQDVPDDAGDVMTIGYAPHSQVFGRAAAVVHHGGIGTTGQAMHAGVPQLIVPFFGDQFDNGARIARLGIGATIRPIAFRGEAALAAIRRVVEDTAIAAHAATVGAIVRRESAAERAAERIAAVARGAI